MDSFKSKFSAAAMSVFGSGYAWLAADKRGHLCIITHRESGYAADLLPLPVMNIDVWEHAYYLKHYNQRAAYIEDWFRVVNWKAADDRYAFCLSCAKK
jgi:Fe-Mn family superoxide dismutase